MTLGLTIAVACLLLIQVATVAGVLVLARELGIVLTRIGPAAAKEAPDRLPIGLPLEDLSVNDFFGRPLTISASSRSLLVFVAPSCSLCHQLLPALTALRGSPPRPVQVVAIGCGPDSEQDQDFADLLEIEDLPYIRNDGLCARFSVSSPPYSVLVEDGLVVAKGITNNLQHLEALFSPLLYDDRGRPALTRHLEHLSQGHTNGSGLSLESKEARDAQRRAV